MKILNYTMFVSSTSVQRYIFSKGVDPDTVYLNDYKFMKSVLHILVRLAMYDNSMIGLDIRLQSKYHTRSILQVWLRRAEDDYVLRCHQLG